jgi:hypothetical protein
VYFITLFSLKSGLVFGEYYNFHPDNLDILTQGSGINVSPPIESMQNIEINGLVPFIFSITPITNLPHLLGEKEEDGEEPFDNAQGKSFEQAQGREENVELSVM